MGKGVKVVVHQVTRANISETQRKAAQQLFKKLEAADKLDPAYSAGQTEFTLQLVDKIDSLAKTDVPVLLVGETGTNKEAAAWVIHNLSGRQGKCVPINCTAIPEHLFESELFGYVEGAFTGALKGGKEGLFKQANKGTVFLDEIGKMPKSMQGKLLRVIDEKAFYKVGNYVSTPVDFRFVAAIQPGALENDDLFLPDLKYRLGYPHTLPMLSLRDKLKLLNDDQTKALIDSVLDDVLVVDMKQEDRKGKLKLNKSCYRKLKQYPYPGNYRELRNILRGGIFAAGHQDKIRVDDLSFDEKSVSAISDKGSQVETFSGRFIDVFDHAKKDADKVRKAIIQEKYEEVTAGGKKLAAVLREEGVLSKSEQERYRRELRGLGIK